jgi:dTDP-4-amino-4,6-dideoxygalactose transaminase
VTEASEGGLAYADPQYVVEISESQYGLSRDNLWAIPRAESVQVRRYFKPGAHRCVPFKNSWPQRVEALLETDGLCQTVLQLPVGATVTSADAATIADLIRAAQVHAGALGSHV